jgi:hypothetical protein
LCLSAQPRRFEALDLATLVFVEAVGWLRRPPTTKPWCDYTLTNTALIARTHAMVRGGGSSLAPDAHKKDETLGRSVACLIF